MKKEKNDLKNIRFSRTYILVGLFVFGLIIYRINMLSSSEIVENVNLQQLASNRTTKQETLYSKRGTIYDVNGDVLAQNVSSYTLIAYLSPSRTGNSKTPQHVVDVDYTAEQLSTVLDIPKEQIVYYLSKDAYQVELGSKAKNLSELKKDEIKALNLPGIDFIETQQRSYPYNSLASYVLGYTKKENVKDENGDMVEELVGEMGIEKYFNDELTGTNGMTLFQKDLQGNRIPNTKEITVEAVDGNDVYLTINRHIQLFVEDALTEISNKCDTEFITMMLADAKTGAILASGTYPTFDPNIKDMTSYLNFNVSAAYEPGSTMKIYSYMAAMEEGVYNGDEKYKSGIFTAKDGTKIGDWKREGWGYITYDQGFAFSSNTAVMNLISKYMDGATLKRYYKKLGFGSETGIELPNEVAGKVNFKYETEILNAGFGQGITTTPIQNVKALTSISNDGILLKPYIVDKIVDHDTGEILYQGGKTEIERVASTKTVQKMKELMRSVVNGDSSNSVTGYYYRVDGYDFIAKTGTAQVAREDGKGYSDTMVTRGLAGMFPGYDPQVIIYLALRSDNCSPKTIAGPVKDVIKNTSKFLGIYDEDKEKTKELDEITVDSYINKEVKSVTSTLASNSISYVVLGDGDKVVAQYPKEGEVINKINKVFLLTNSETIKMPKIIGYSARDFYSLVNLLKIPYTTDGIGYVSEQSIKEGTVLNKETVLEVKFTAKY